ncbi:Uncharacterised protein [Vibrio cholerae]|nr:Uncharacterised protein [Vibrio cholerae]
MAGFSTGNQSVAVADMNVEAFTMFSLRDRDFGVLRQFGYQLFMLIHQIVMWPWYAHHQTLQITNFQRQLVDAFYAKS